MIVYCEISGSDSSKYELCFSIPFAFLDLSIVFFSVLANI
jgi:hypothetical protein